MMADTDHRAPPVDPPDGDRPGNGWFGRFRARLQDRLWRADEAWAAERGYAARRSVRGWSVDIRDPRFDRRHACDTCAGTGRHHITGADCADCGGVGVVTDPERGEQA